MDTAAVQRLLDSGELEVRPSPRRKKTISLSKEAGRWVLATPARFRPERNLEVIAGLLTRLARRTEHTPESDERLWRRALELNDAYFADGIAPRSVRWVTNQFSRFASCSVETGDIRVSHRLRQVPGWVLDAVVVHELAHLREAHHNAAFKALISRYERTADAEIYLAGFSAGEASRSQSTAPPGAGSDR